ncbi:deoxyuridine 5'-triphosphate nucleotidohydrolase-like [Macrosteles quadrilineatus]|uniref:deoxyuridine 5'-triphosphate nucleotidohydrolase-like n=1 Tax=Macrosteles quadrilineatus TaxID=74068 RepID=UPI0023E0ADA1|nr:deoxyuridine 5'-triphosphate nucleotidohydrolase-like [Macrosteles quadrilineatus]
MNRSPVVELVGTAPVYQHPTDAGADLYAAEDVEIPSQGRLRVKTGTKVAIPEGWVGMVCPRSGLAAGAGITVLNAPGIIDSGFRGELEVLLYNSDGTTHYVPKGIRIAQLVLLPYGQAVFTPVHRLPPAERGSGGFGSTGL